MILIAIIAIFRWVINQLITGGAHPLLTFIIIHLLHILENLPTFALKITQM